jgi:hypothetical protein
MGLRERQRGAGETARDGSEERRRSAGWVGRGAAELTPSTQSRGPDARPRRAQAPGTLVSSDTLIGRSLVPSAALFLCDFGGLFSGNESRSLSPADATPRRPSDTTPCGRIGHIVHHPTVLLRLLVPGYPATGGLRTLPLPDCAATGSAHILVHEIRYEEADTSGPSSAPYSLSPSLFLGCVLQRHRAVHNSSREVGLESADCELMV